MKDFRDFWEYVQKNKYVIICIAVVVVLYALGIVEFLTKVVILVALVVGAIFLGKYLQDNEEKIKDVISSKPWKKDNTYYYDANIKKK